MSFRMSQKKNCQKAIRSFVFVSRCVEMGVVAEIDEDLVSSHETKEMRKKQQWSPRCCRCQEHRGGQRTWCRAPNKH